MHYIKLLDAPWLFSCLTSSILLAQTFLKFKKDFNLFTTYNKLIFYFYPFRKEPMNRRELLKKSVVASLGLSFAPGLLVSLESCSKARPTTDQPVYLNEEQFDAIWKMAELILPPTDSPGAHEAGVAPFIDQLFGLYFEEEVKTTSEAGLQLFLSNCTDQYGKGFIDLEKEKQIDYLNSLDKSQDPDSFFKSMKKIILWAYFTSEAGMKSMNYLPVPGRYNGCITIDKNEKNLVGNR